MQKTSDKGLLSKINKELLKLYKKMNNLIKKWAKEKMLNIRNANQNYNEVSPHTGQSGHHQKIYK